MTSTERALNPSSPEYTWGVTDDATGERRLIIYSECCADTFAPEELPHLVAALRTLAPDVFAAHDAEVAANAWDEGYACGFGYVESSNNPYRADRIEREANPVD